jgi:dTDP-4-amino-4,6-dideoxygalactose transaminase
MKIPFFKPPTTGNELNVLEESLSTGHHTGNGPFSKKAHSFIEAKFKIGKCLLTTSCTDALEMCALLVDAKPGDEVIVPSYTFSSSALAFASNGFKPVFVDVDITTKNITIENILKGFTEKTRAIVVVHYAGIVCDMDPIMDFAKKNNIVVIEDAAQAVNSIYKNKYAGSIADLATFSFHATKGYSCGEGGALLINNSNYYDRADFLWEKGTNRSQVVSGITDKYSWIDWGSSFLLSDILAALLFDQLNNLNSLQLSRKKVFDKYYNFFNKKTYCNSIRHIELPENVQTNFHAFWIEFKDLEIRHKLISKLKSYNIDAYIGYVPLHSSKKGKQIGLTLGEMKNTENAGNRLLRLPLYQMSDNEIKYVIEKLKISIDSVLN